MTDVLETAELARLTAQVLDQVSARLFARVHLVEPLRPVPWITFAEGAWITPDESTPLGVPLGESATVIDYKTTPATMGYLDVYTFTWDICRLEHRCFHIGPYRWEKCNVAVPLVLSVRAQIYAPSVYTRFAAYAASVAAFSSEESLVMRPSKTGVYP